MYYMYVYYIHVQYMYIIHCAIGSVHVHKIIILVLREHVFYFSVGRIIQAQRQVTESLRTLNLSMRAQNINPFLSPEERRELELIEQSRSRLMSTTKLFLLEQSYPT